MRRTFTVEVARGGRAHAGHETIEWDEFDWARCKCGVGDTIGVVKQHLKALDAEADAPDMCHSLAVQ